MDLTGFYVFIPMSWDMVLPSLFITLLTLSVFDVKHRERKREGGKEKERGAVEGWRCRDEGRRKDGGKVISHGWGLTFERKH